MRVGRGEGSGHGKTSGRGHKGQKARSGGFHKIGFEGGQMPLMRRLPKRGFANIFKKEMAIVNVGDLNKFKAGDEVTLDVLKTRKVVKGKFDGLKVLGQGDISIALTVKAKLFSKTALAKIEKAGGKAVVQ
jgi:large subunit ribosomal protein L15